MSVTIILVFGERVSKLIPELTLLQWFHSYIGQWILFILFILQYKVKVNTVPVPE